MRYIRTNEGTHLPVNCLFVDTETKPIGNLSTPKSKVHSLLMGIASSNRWDNGQFTRRTDYNFVSPQHFLSILDKVIAPKQRLWIFSHNAGFDSTIAGLWRLADFGDIKLEYIVSQSPPTIIRFSRNGNSCVWLDTMNWFRCSLKKIGELVGLPKLKMPSDHDSIAEWDYYCTRDVDILIRLVELLFRFHDQHDLGCFRFTASSQAMQVYKHRLAPTMKIMRDPLPGESDKPRKVETVLAIEPHQNGVAKLLERSGYFQGKSWCYFLGKVVPGEEFLYQYSDKQAAKNIALRFSPVYSLDVNALYPSVMLSEVYPTRLLGVQYHPSLEEMSRILDTHCIVANVLLNTPIDEFPVELEKNTRFCTGMFWTTLCSPELRYALNKGYVKKCSMMATYACGNIFANYVKFFYDLKMRYQSAGNQVFADLCKLYLVSLYGKFAQRQGSWENLPDEKPETRWSIYTKRDPSTGKILTQRGVADLCQQLGDDKDCEHSFVAIAAHVTSAGRVRMKYLEDIAGVDGLFYSNVDSFHCDQIAFDNLQSAGEVSQQSLGKLKIEKISKQAEYRNIRDYSLDGVDTISGVKSDAVKTDDGNYESTEFEKLDSILSRQPVPTVEVKIIDVHLQRVYGQGRVNSDGSTDYKVLKLGETRPICDETGRIYDEHFADIKTVD